MHALASAFICSHKRTGWRFTSFDLLQETGLKVCRIKNKFAESEVLALSFACTLRLFPFLLGALARARPSHQGLSLVCK